MTGSSQHGREKTQALPQPGIQDAEFDNFVQVSNGYAEEALRDSKKNARNWRYCCFGALTGVVALCFAQATLIKRHTEHWGLMVADPVSGMTRVAQDLSKSTVELPESVDNWFLERYVDLREKWTLADARSAFTTVVCMSSPEEQKQFEEWYNKDPLAPRQLFLKSRAGWREVKITAGSARDGMAPDRKSYRVSIPFSWEDKGLSEAKNPTGSGIIRFTVHKDPKARQPCNPVGLVISQYSRQINRGVGS